MSLVAIMPKWDWAGLLAKHCSFLSVERFGTSPRNCRIWLGASGRRCPTAFFDEMALLQSMGAATHFLHLRQVRGSVRGLLELVNAERRESGDNGRLGPAPRERLGSTASDPTTPVKAYERKSKGSACSAPQRWLHGIPGRLRDFHGISPSFGGKEDFGPYIEKYCSLRTFHNIYQDMVLLGLLF
jgi:hypothetical protein